MGLIKFIRTKTIRKPVQQVDPTKQLIKLLTDRILTLLEQYGISDMEKRVHCTAAIFAETGRYFAKIQKHGKADDYILIDFTDALKAVLAKYGQPERDKQESFILEYLQAIEDVS